MSPKSTDTRLAVLKVLRGQSPGYAIFPNASAFVAEGLDSGDVASALDELHRDGVVERELIVNDDDTSVPGGYRLTAEGGNEVRDETETEPTEPTPTDPTPDDGDDTDE